MRVFLKVIENFYIFMENIFKRDIDSTLNLLDKYNNDGKNIYKIIDELIYFMKNLLIYNIMKH